MRLVLATYFTFITIMFVRCGKETEIDELIKQTDKIQIVFADNVKNYIDLKSKSDIEKFGEYISDEDAPMYSCNQDGQITFFTEHGSVAMNFSLSAGCQHVEYDYGGSVQIKKITEAGFQYLSSLHK